MRRRKVYVALRVRLWPDFGFTSPTMPGVRFSMQAPSDGSVGAMLVFPSLEALHAEYPGCDDYIVLNRDDE